MSVHEVLRAATGVAGKTLSDPALGTLTPGSYADFVALKSNPLRDISVLRAIDAVYKNGKEVASTTMMSVNYTYASVTRT